MSTDADMPMPGAFPTTPLPHVEDNTAADPTVNADDSEDALDEVNEHPHDTSDSTSTSRQSRPRLYGDLVELRSLLDHLTAEIRTLIVSITPPQDVDNTSAGTTRGDNPQNDEPSEDVEMSDA